MTKQEKETYELIERYINHDLSKEEQGMFELRMKKDAEFEKDVKAHAEVHQLMMDQGLINIRKKLKKIHQTETGEDDPKWKYFSGTALVIIAASLLFFYKSSFNEKELSRDNVKVIVEPTDKVDKTDKNKEDQSAAKKDEVVKEKKNSELYFPIVDKNMTNDTVQVEKYTPPVISSIPKVEENYIKDTSIVAIDKSIQQNKIDCSVILISGEVNTNPSCDDQSTGNILVALGSLKGGKKPYKFSINENDGFTIASNFNNLPAGIYKMTVKDDNGCVNLLKEVEIKSKNCPHEYSFYPDRGGWEIPLKVNSNAEIKIMNSRTGLIVYTSLINNGYPDLWNGVDNSGLNLPMGSYSFIITYDSGQIVQGYVTIMR